MKDHDKNKELSYLKYWDLSNLYDQVILQNLPINNFGWVEDIIRLIRFHKRTIMKKVMKDIFSKLKFNILKNYINFTMIYRFYLKE